MRYRRLAPIALAALALSSTVTMAQPSASPFMKSTYSPTFSSGYNPAIGYSAHSYYSSGWTNWRKGIGANASCSGWRRLLCGDFSVSAEPAQTKPATHAAP